MNLHPLKFKSTSVFEIGFESTSNGRGNLYVRFHDGNGKPTGYGYYKDAPRAVYNGLLASRAAGRFLTQNLKPHFEWSKIVEGEPPEIAHFRAHPDLTLPDEISVPMSVPIADTIPYWDAQRVGHVGGLFE